MTERFVKNGLLFAVMFILVVNLALWFIVPVLVQPVTQGAGTAAEAVIPSAGWPYGVVGLIAAVLAMTGAILLAVRLGLGRLVRAFLVFGTFWILVFALAVIVLRVTGFLDYWMLVPVLGVAAGLMWLAFVRNHYSAGDVIGILVLSYAAVTIGFSFSPVAVIAVVVILAVYDFIAVYWTGHMMSLAKAFVGQGVPIGLMVLGAQSGEKLDLGQPRSERKWIVLGWGDLGIPAAFVIAVGRVAPAVALGATWGAVAGYFLLAWIAERFPGQKGHAGLPPIIGCMLVGSFIGLVAVLGVP